MKKLTRKELDAIYAKGFCLERFKAVDPCGIVYELLSHTTRQLDIELGALLVAMITWGNRKAIRTAARHMIGEEMAWQPADFILGQRYWESYAEARNRCVYRTLDKDHFCQVCDNLRLVLEQYRSQHPDEELTLEKCLSGLSMEQCITTLTQWLAPARLGTMGKTACKRICMFLRWMVRTETPDLGLWHTRQPSELYAVMDVHVCQLTASLLTHKSASWQACEELTQRFRRWNREDPLRYDIALMTLADEGPSSTL